MIERIRERYEDWDMSTHHLDDIKACVLYLSLMFVITTTSIFFLTGIIK